MTDQAHTVTFETYSTLLDVAENGPTDMRPSLRASRRTGSGFSDVSEFAQAMALARNGWAEGRERVKTLSDALYSRITRRMFKYETVNDVLGDALDLGAYVRGIPNAMLRDEETEEMVTGRGKIVRLTFNIVASSGISKEVLYARGAAVVALIDLLENAGRRVEVTLASRNRGRGSAGAPRSMISVTLKRPEAPLQIDQLAFALCHPASLRRIIFSIMETFPHAVRVAVGVERGGYGMVDEVPTDQRGDIYVTGADYSQAAWLNESDARRWITEQLRAQGVVLADDAAGK